MPCEACHVQFGLITRKKCCAECRRLFCRSCLERRDERILCQNCLVLTKRPLSKVDLGQLKVKELIFYLQSKHISTSGCVEKDDLVNLVLAHVNTGTTNSPRSPLGSPGSPGGNGTYGSTTGAFHFSSASSTGGSSGGGGRRRPDGGRGSNSGASSRYGQFYSASAENCANTFDQIKNTCQNLFSSISEKLGSDPKSQQPHNPGGPRFSNSSTEENLRPRPDRTSPTGVYQQPRFGSNDVYQVNLPPPTTTPGISPTDEVRNGPGMVPNADEDGGSGLTSGADDTSANASSVSSPEHRSGAADALSVRIENMLASDAIQNPGGCDCSDDEEEAGREEPKKSASEENLLPEVEPAAEAGPSQRLSVPESNTDTCSSSFDELNPECVASPPERPPTADPTDPENWQIVHVPTPSAMTPSPINESTLPQTTISTATMTEQPQATTNSGDDVPPVCPSQTPRRHSDSSFLLAVIPSGSRGRSPVPEPPAQSSQPSVITNKCFKCGKRRNGLRRQLKKFRRQLEVTGGVCSEAEKRRQLEAFLGYLERRSKGSLELSTDTDSITDQDASISLALDGEPMELGGGAEGSSHYPRGGDDEGLEVKITVYSSGNQDLANMSHLKLSDIKESADLDVLSVKQLKELLMLNRVDFKGCCEKPELRERVLRLWRDFKSIPSIEKLTTDDLCKICMDAPIECVILECGHMTTCTACGKVLSECPICRQYIVRVVRFFRA
ncbi:mucin-5AC [Culex quinquefasciatus]|nr:mucin-5AC [Culex quinquefasciatus]